MRELRRRHCVRICGAPRHRLYGYTSLLTTWRKLHREGRLGADAAPSFAPVIVAPEPGPAAVMSRPGPRADRVEIVLVSGRRLLVDCAIDPAALTRLVQVLDRA